MRAHRSNHVRAWLEAIRLREPTREASVLAWLERIPFDATKVKHGKGTNPVLDNIAPLPVRVSPKTKTETRNRAQRQSIYFHEETLQEILAESQRQERTVSWILQQTWRLAAPTIKQFPSMEKIA